MPEVFVLHAARGRPRTFPRVPCRATPGIRAQVRMSLDPPRKFALPGRKRWRCYSLAPASSDRYLDASEPASAATRDLGRRAPSNADPPRPWGWRSLSRDRPLSDVPCRTPGTTSTLPSRALLRCPRRRRSDAAGFTRRTRPMVRSPGLGETVHGPERLSSCRALLARSHHLRDALERGLEDP